MGSYGRDEKLWAICICSSIGHREVSFFLMLQVEILIIECESINRFSTCPITVWEVSSLDHEAFDDSVEGTTLLQ